MVLSPLQFYSFRDGTSINPLNIKSKFDIYLHEKEQGSGETHSRIVYYSWPAVINMSKIGDEKGQQLLSKAWVLVKDE